MTTPHTTPNADCPKRVWVLQAFSDDEGHADGDLPQGLRFHLGRCPSCRELAERLSAASAALTGLAAAPPPPPDFAAAARARVVEALNRGATLTGRVSLPEDAPPIPAARPWRLYATLSAAAALTFAATIWVLRSADAPPLTGPDSQFTDTSNPIDGPTRTPDAPLSTAPVETRVAVKGSELPPVRRYTNPVDAAFSNDNGSVQAAFTLPPPRSGGLTALIDRMRGDGSTGSNPPPQQP